MPDELDRPTRHRHLVSVEGVSEAEAEAFLDVAEAAVAEDPESPVLRELDARIAARAHLGVLRSLASSRDSRATAADVARLQDMARRATK